MAQILNFPKDKISNTRPTNTEEEREKFIYNKTKFVDNVVEHYSSQLLNKLMMHGFDMEEENFFSDYVFMVESLRSCLLRNLGVEHQIQKISDITNQLIDEDREFDIELDDEEPN